MEVEKKEERVLPIDWVATVLLTKEAQEVGTEALKDCSLQKNKNGNIHAMDCKKSCEYIIVYIFEGTILIFCTSMFAG